MSTQTILIKFQKKLIQGQLELPSLPAVTLRIRDAIQDPDQDLVGIAKIANADPGFCAYLINLANSPMYRGIRPSSDVQQALARIGMRKLRSLAMSYATKSLFDARNVFLKRWLTSIWSISVSTASFAVVIAEHLQLPNVEDALLAGLLLDIGALPLLKEASSDEDFAKDEAAVQLLIQKYAAVAGEAIIKAWNMPATFLTVIKERENWLREAPEADLADLILLARYHALLVSKKKPTLPKLVELPLLDRLGLTDIEPDDSLSFIKEAQEKIQNIRSALTG